MHKVFEITRVYYNYIVAKDERTARKLEREIYSDIDPIVTVIPVGAKLSPEQLAQIVEAAE